MRFALTVTFAMFCYFSQKSKDSEGFVSRNYRSYVALKRYTISTPLKLLLHVHTQTEQFFSRTHAFEYGVSLKKPTF
jgi:hypothetical protein